MSVAVEFRGVSKSYPVYARSTDRLKELLTLNRASFHSDFWALRDIDVTIARGETFCIIGENGSGKSTLLQIIAGILQVSSGIAAVHGRVSALLELGSGFNPEFSGRDNVYLNASILGLSRKEIDRRYAAIEAFAEIGEFIDQPVKTYSSGMAVRLAFAVAIHVDPEILLVDEALAVGDIYFRQRCMRRVHDLRASGVTIVYVSHAMSDVKAIGDRCLWLDRGRIRELGATDSVVTKYLAEMSARDAAYLKSAPLTVQHPAGAAPPQVLRSIPNCDHRHGNGAAEILGIGVYSGEGQKLFLLEPASSIVVRVSAQANRPIARPNIGLMMRNHLGIDFAATNTLREGHQLPPLAAGEVVTVDFHFDLPFLYPSTFSFSPAIAEGPLESYTMCDWIDNALSLQMSHGEGQVYGYIHLPCRIEVNSQLGATPSRAEVA